MEDFETEYALEELICIKEKTQMFRSAKILMNIISALLIIGGLIGIASFLMKFYAIGALFN